jgi:hypothetical protein
MTLEQAMHFYRDIRYYQRHAGMNQTLDQLVDALMTKRFLPIADYTMRHDTTTQVDDIYPAITFKRTDMTSIPSAGTPEFINTDTFLAKEVPEAADNSDEISYASPMIQQFLMDSPSNVVQTKVLESAMIDYTGAQTYGLEGIQVNHWLYYASLGRYTAVINVSNPKTSERIVLTVKDAYVLATYCMFKSFEITPDVIPLLCAERVQRYPIPPDTDLKSIVDMKYVDDFSWNTAKEFVSEVDDMISIDAFYEKTSELYKSANFQRNLISYQEGMHERCEVYKLVERYWCDAYVYLEDKTLTYTDWLFSRNLNFDTLDRDEFELLYQSIVAAAIGSTLSTTPSLRNVQKAMTAALKSLSSYTIQVVSQMADDQTIMTDLPSVRVGDQLVSGTSHEYVRIGDMEVLSQAVSASNMDNLPINIFSDVMSHKVTGTGKLYMNLYNGPHEPDRGAFYQHYFPISRIDVGVVNKPDVTGTNLQPLLGMEYYMALTADEKNAIFQL